jgi:flavin reductase (DIM6/NTAB) family NADH-FMN oxidoreductase RutF
MIPEPVRCVRIGHVRSVFFPAKGSTSWSAIRERGAFCVNVLGADQEAVCRQLAAKGGDKFDGVEWSPSAHELPALAGAVARIGCEIEAVHDAGDPDIVVGVVRHLDADEATVPLLFFQGGYGRFLSSSIAAVTERDIVEHLRLVEGLRADIVEASH